MATIVLFNGALNVLILGIPAYIWTFLVVTLMLIFSNAYWYLIFWSPLKSLHGLWRATWGKTDAALVADLDTNMKLVSEAQAKLIFDEEIAEAKRDEKDWTGITSGQMGVIGTDIILDLGKWTNINNDDRYVIQKAVDDFNLLNPDDQVHSFQKFMRYCESGKIEVEIPIFVLVEWLRIESAFPRERSKAAYAGYIRQLAERLDKEERSKFDTYAIYMLVAAGVISVLFILSKFLIHKPA